MIVAGGAHPGYAGGGGCRRWRCQATKVASALSGAHECEALSAVGPGGFAAVAVERVR